MKSKSNIRQHYFAWRKALDQDAVALASRQVWQHLQALSVFDASTNIFSYVAVFNEIDTKPIINALMDSGKKVSIPAFDESSAMYIASVFTNWDNITQSTRGLPQPKLLLPADPKLIEIAICPGIAFDRTGNRIGFGSGHFDKLLTTFRKECTKIGLAYGKQIVTKIPAEPHDVAMDYVITETETIDCRGYTTS